MKQKHTPGKCSATSCCPTGECIEGCNPCIGTIVLSGTYDGESFEIPFTINQSVDSLTDCCWSGELTYANAGESPFVFEKEYTRTVQINWTYHSVIDCDPPYGDGFDHYDEQYDATYETTIKSYVKRVYLELCFAECVIESVLQPCVHVVECTIEFEDNGGTYSGNPVSVASDDHQTAGCVLNVGCRNHPAGNYFYNGCLDGTEDPFDYTVVNCVEDDFSPYESGATLGLGNIQVLGEDFPYDDPDDPCTTFFTTDRIFTETNDYNWGKLPMYLPTYVFCNQGGVIASRVVTVDTAPSDLILPITLALSFTECA